MPTDRLTGALKVFRRWVASRGLRPSQVEYLAATRDRRPLRFTAAGDLTLELTYAFTGRRRTCRSGSGSG